MAAKTLTRPECAPIETASQRAKREYREGKERRQQVARERAAARERQEATARAERAAEEKKAKDAAAVSAAVTEIRDGAKANAVTSRLKRTLGRPLTGQETGDLRAAGKAAAKASQERAQQTRKARAQTKEREQEVIRGAAVQAFQGRDPGRAVQSAERTLGRRLTRSEVDYVAD